MFLLSSKRFSAYFRLRSFLSASPHLGFSLVQLKVVFIDLNRVVKEKIEDDHILMNLKESFQISLVVLIEDTLSLLSNFHHCL